MPSPDDKLTDIPQMIPERDELDSYRRQRIETPEPRKPAKPAKAAATESAAAGVSSGWRLLAVAGLLIKPAQDAMLGLFNKKTTAVMTNVPGPKEKLKFCGSTIEENMFWVPQTGDVLSLIHI